MARPLFTDAPIIQSAPIMPVQPSGSALAGALMRGNPNFSLPPANFGGGIPLASMAMMHNGGTQGAGPTPEQLLGLPPAPTPQPQINTPGGASDATLTPGAGTPPSWLSQVMPQMPGQVSGVNPNGGSMPMPMPTPGPGMPSAGTPGAPGLWGQLLNGIGLGGMPSGAPGGS